MSIIITPSETNLIEEFKKQNIPFECENLLVGDIHIKHNDTVQYIFERKAKGDLDASIKDGRYSEQKTRLCETGLNLKNIVYIIESLKDPNEQRLWSAICNTQHRDGFSVFQTKNTAETVKYIAGIATAIKKNEPTKAISTEKVSVDIKKKSVGIDDWFKYSLTLIPRCSLTIASVIVENYPKIGSLITEINQNGIECLSDLKHGSSQRKIGKKLSVDICKTIMLSY